MARLLRYPNLARVDAPGFLNELNRELRLIVDQIDKVENAAVSVTAGLHVARTAIASVVSGSLYYETDRTVLFLARVLNGSLQWTWLAGTMLGTFTTDQRPTDLAEADEGFMFSATDDLHTWRWSGSVWVLLPELSSPMRGTLSPDQKPSLTANDIGFLFYSTDFAHTYRWTGSAWEQAPGDDRIGSFLYTDGVVSPGTGWQLCNGSATTRSTPTGGTAAVTVPDYSIASYVKGATVASLGPNAASGVTASTTATNNAIATGVTVDSNTTGVDTDSHTTVAVQSGAGTTVLNGPLDHIITDSGHAHGITDPTHNHTQNAHNHGPGTLELRNTVAQVHYRL